MPFLREISITRLFGLYDHDLSLRADPPVTIVAGPNGIGKTTLLALTHAFLTGEPSRTVQTPIRETHGGD
jgi:predicted ATP-binding protein involved in virulence